MKVLLLLAAIVAGCAGPGGEKIDRRTNNPVDPRIQELEEKVLELQGTVAQINNFVAKDFASCDSSLPPFETKICQIAQTATAEQQVVLFGQLQNLQTIIQDSLYGADCINDTDIGCPVAGSVLEQLSSIDITTIESDIAQLQTDVVTIQTSISTINTRLDDFDGSGQSIEVVIAGIESDIAGLDSRVSDIENTVGGADYYQWIFIGNDIASVSANEPVLRTGDGLTVVAYVNSSTENGMGVIAEAGVTGDQYLRTDVRPRVRFKIYDLTTELRICWDNTDRNAAEATIDTECDSANSFATPTANCTCE